MKTQQDRNFITEAEKEKLDRFFQSIMCDIRNGKDIPSALIRVFNPSINTKKEKFNI